MRQTRRITASRGVLLAIVVVAGAILRYLVVRSHMGDLNADEAYTGLQSIGIAHDHRFPVVIDGNTYSAPLEAYFLAPLITHLSGGVAVMKWLFVGIWGGAAITTAGAARRLVGNRGAAIAGSLVWLAPGALLVLSTRAYVCYGLGLLVVSAMVWALSVAADQPQPDARVAAFSGFLVGLAFYIHPMFLTVALPAVAVVSFVHRREWRCWWLPAAAGAVLANLPFLAWNAANGWPSLSSGSSDWSHAGDRFRGFFERLFPRGLGLRGFDGTWVVGRTFGVLCYASIAGLVVYGCLCLVRRGHSASRWIVPAMLCCCTILMSPLVNLGYVDDGRYSIIPFAGAVIAISAAVAGISRRFVPHHALAVVAASAVIWVSVTSIPFIVEQDVFNEANANAWQEQLVDRLDEAGIHYVAGSYFLVLPIEYRSERRIRAAALGPLDAIRFPTSQRAVMNAPKDEVAFVSSGPADPGMLYLDPGQYRVEVVAGVTLYLPPAAAT